MTTTTERPLADTLTAIKTRRSVKEYLDTDIPREWIEELLDAAHWAPNHKLTHPWRFHVFTGKGRERLVEARQASVRWAAEKKGQPPSEDDLNFARAKCFSSPAVIIVSMVGDDNKIVDQENYAACWCAIENLLVAATARVGAFPLNFSAADSALLVSLPPAPYTVQVSGADGGSGIALVEIYEVP